MFEKPEICRVCGAKYQRLPGVPRSIVHSCPGPQKLKIYTEEEKRAFEEERKKEPLEKKKPVGTKVIRGQAGRSWVVKIEQVKGLA